jgi:hypothetical protein
MLPNHLRRLEHVHLEPRLALIQHHVHVVLRASRRSRGVGRQLRTAPFLWGGGGERSERVAHHDRFLVAGGSLVRRVNL